MAGDKIDEMLCSKAATTIFVGQVPYDSTANELEEHFKSFGVKSIAISLSKGKSARGTAFGVCPSKSDIVAAKRAHNSVFKGKKLVVEPAKEKPERSSTTKFRFRNHRVFIGQLPYTASVQDIQNHMDSFGVGELKIRLLTDKKTGKSRGIAFADCTDDLQVVRALRVHHTRFNERTINVERTVGGGGKGKKRKGRLQNLRVMQGVKTITETKQALESILNLSKSGNVKLEELDDKVIEALATFPRKVVDAIFKEFVALDFTTVKNKSAYLMGMISRYRTKLHDGSDFVAEESSLVAMRREKKVRRRRS